MEDLEFFRAQIDEVDKQLLNLLLDRKNLVKKIWDYKKWKDIDAYQPDRWQKVLDSRKAFAKEIGLDEKFIETFWNDIHKYSLEVEK